jgi:5-methylcytosine-specific restriction protein A
MAEKIKAFKKEEIKSYYDNQRAEDQAFYHSIEWKKCRNLFIRLNPMCFDCQNNGYDTPAYEVHHIKKRKDFPELAFAHDNLMGLCKSCHTKRTNQEKHGPADTVVLLGYQSEQWIAKNGKQGDLIFDFNKLKAAINFPNHEPADITSLINIWRGELFRLMKLEQIKRRVIILTTDYSTAASIAKDLGAGVTESVQS